MPDLIVPKPSIALTIAGHDPSSGAGITADLQTFAAHGVFGTSAITALTIQSTLGVAAVVPVDAVILRQTLQHLCADLPPGGVKIGMLGSTKTVTAVADFLAAAETPKVPVVLDPILRSSSGAEMLPREALQAFHEELLPQVSWITPNWSELAILAGTQSITTLEAATAAMRQLAARHPQLTIVATGGDQKQPVDLLRLPSGEMERFSGEHIASSATHGTGCAFSSALLARLMEGNSPVDAVAQAKHFVADAIRLASKIGHGKGPMNLLWPFRA